MCGVNQKTEVLIKLKKEIDLLMKSKYGLKKVNKSIVQQLRDLTEEDLVVGEAFDVEEVKASYIPEIISVFKHSDGTYGDSYMEPYDEYFPDIKFYYNDVHQLKEHQQDMLRRIGEYYNFKSGWNSDVKNYIKKEFQSRNSRDLYNYPREIRSISLHKMNLLYMKKYEFPCRPVFAKIKSVKGNDVYILLAIYNFETDIVRSFDNTLSGSSYCGISFYDLNFNRLKTKVSLFGTISI